MLLAVAHLAVEQQETALALQPPMELNCCIFASTPAVGAAVLACATGARVDVDVHGCCTHLVVAGDSTGA